MKAVAILSQWVLVCAVILWTAASQEPDPAPAPVLQVASSTVAAANKFPAAAIDPVAYGYSGVKFGAGDYGDRVYQPKSGQTFTAEPGAKFGHFRIRDINGVTVRGMDLASVYIWNADDCTVEFNLIGNRVNQQSPGVRVMYGSERAKIRHNVITRGGVPNDGDTGGILFSNGWSADGVTYHPNADCVVEQNIIRGSWTDSIQACQTAFNKFSECPGLVIRNNTLYLEPRHAPEWKQAAHIEQQGGIDLKTGGTEANPVLVERNMIYGAGRSARNPLGYAIVVQNDATDIQFRHNVIDAWGGVSLAPPRTGSPWNAAWFDRRITFENNDWRVRDAVIYHTDTASLSGDTFIFGRTIEDKPAAPQRQPRSFDGCTEIKVGSQ